MSGDVWWGHHLVEVDEDKSHSSDSQRVVDEGMMKKLSDMGNVRSDEDLHVKHGQSHICLPRKSLVVSPAFPRYIHYFLYKST